MPGTRFRWRYHIRSFQHLVTEKRTQQIRYLVAKEYADRSRDRRFERLLHQVKFIDSRRTSLTPARFMEFKIEFITEAAFVGTTAICRLTTTATILNDRDSRPYIYYKEGKNNSEYIAESLHNGCKDKQI